MAGKYKGLEEGKNHSHLDAFVISIVRFLRVHIYKTDLRGTKGGQDIKVTV